MSSQKAEHQSQTYIPQHSEPHPLALGYKVHISRQVSSHPLNGLTKSTPAMHCYGYKGLIYRCIWSICSCSQI